MKNVKNAGRVLLSLVVISFLFLAADEPQAQAQDENEPGGFENVLLWVYPEYDDPGLLVMLEGQIVGVEAPVNVRFLVPSAAEMYSAGSMDAQGQYTGGPPNREPSSVPGWDEINYDVTTDTFRVEYYDPIIKGQPDKTISYEFRWLYPISGLTIIVQEPRKSTDFYVSLGEGDPDTTSEGFALHVYSYRDLDDDPPIRFEIAYTKSDLNPSLSIGSGGSTNTALTVVLIVGLVLLLGGGLFWIIKSRPKTRAERRSAPRNAAVHGSKGKRPAGKFCAQCGQRLENAVRFCPHCGTELQ